MPISTVAAELTKEKTKLNMVTSPTTVQAEQDDPPPPAPIPKAKLNSNNQESTNVTKSNPNNYVLTPFVLRMIREYFWLGNVIFMVHPIKFNKKLQVYMEDKESLLNRVARRLHIAARLFCAVAFLVFYTTLSDPSPWDAGMSVGVAIFSICSATIHILFLQEPTSLVCSLNYLLSINRAFGQVNNSEGKGCPEQKSVKMTAALATGALSLLLVLIIPLGIIICYALEIRLVLFGVHLAMKLYGISETSALVLVVAVVELSFMSEFLLWTLIVGIITHISLANYCFRTNFWRDAKENARNFKMLRQLQLLHNLSQNLFIGTAGGGVFVLLLNLLIATLLFFVALVYKTESDRIVHLVLLLILLQVMTVIYFMYQMWASFDKYTKNSGRFLHSFLNGRNNCSLIEHKIMKSLTPFTFKVGGWFEMELEQFSILMNNFTLNCLLTLLITYL